MSVKVYPYKQGSRSALALALALGGRVLRVQNSAFQPRERDVVINWGSSQCPSFAPARVLNPPKAVSLAANKRESFATLAAANVPVPRFATDATSALGWNSTIVVRHKLTGHSGEGIEIVEPGADLPSAPLYVEYVKKEDEYRVHVIGESIILLQRKARNRDVENPNWKVRNHANGFVFVRSDVNPPECVLSAAVDAIRALGLDFGGVDVIFNRKSGKAYVLEVNTAVGMAGSTSTDYANAIREYLK